MTIEQKAKAYDAAIEKAEGIIKYYKECNRDEASIEDLETIFPELCESEDEKIRKWLIAQLKIKIGDNATLNNMIYKAIAWLEKQGEQKPTLRERYKNIAESEWFKKTHNGMSVSNDEEPKWTDDDKGEQKPANKVKPKFKVGDWVVNTVGDTNQVVKVLDDGYTLDDNTFISNSWATEHYHLWTIDDAKEGDVLTNGDFPCIFKRCDGNGSLYVYCGINAHNDFSILSEDSKNIWDDYSKQYFPATKEQRDLLFQKISEAGYEWDEEEKELKKIEQKPAWSEEDDDDAWMNGIISKAENNLQLNKAEIDWLKSIKQRHTWKPSDEQMKALHDMNLTGNISYAGQGQTLIELYNDLKKLKGE